MEDCGRTLKCLSIHILYSNFICENVIVWNNLAIITVFIKDNLLVPLLSETKTKIPGLYLYYHPLKIQIKWFINKLKIKINKIIKAITILNNIFTQMFYTCFRLNQGVVFCDSYQTPKLRYVDFWARYWNHQPCFVAVSALLPPSKTNEMIHFCSGN